MHYWLVFFLFLSKPVHIRQKSTMNVKMAARLIHIGYVFFAPLRISDYPRTCQLMKWTNTV